METARREHTVDSPRRIRWRRFVVGGFIVVQLGLVVRAYEAPHREFGFHMFPEASTWSADIVRVTHDGRREPVDRSWAGYSWNQLVRTRGLSSPWRTHHADAGVTNQLAFLGEALDWVAHNTARDTETRFYEAVVTTSHNGDPPEQVILRSVERTLP
ncbi:MAG: hypothetical protein HKN41_03850 [Ilumatobacter sp.]|nr:hypothetical protein [Ilumatobacter sp.]